MKICAADRFPGRIGPGLIEAGKRPAIRSTSTHFPGELARASLKPLRRGRGEYLANTVFPGRIGPGLIEARSCSVRPQWVVRFPGRIGPGLIEASSRKQPTPCGGSDFPGELARASLKHGIGTVVAGAAAFPFPGRIGPGLIEAQLDHDQVGERVDDFPGELARASLKRVGHGIGIRARLPISRANWPGPH